MTQNDCEIAIDPQGFKDIAEYLKRKNRPWQSALIISDENVWRYLGDTIKHNASQAIPRIETFLLPPGETSKTIEQLQKCWQFMLDKNLDKSSLVISLGGGVVTDLAGFAAATFMRGIDLIHIPTTLLGMVDAAIGGKNGVNLPSAKNIIGTITHPKMVLIDPSCLQSLSEKEFRSGMAEVIKHGIIWDAGYFNYLDHHMEQILQRKPEVVATTIARSCEIKSEVIQQDQRHKGLRDILNYGHTFGHAIESATGYQTYSHGEAVAIGMSCAGYLGREMGMVDNLFIARQDALIRKAGLPVELPDIPFDTLIDLMAKDKKTVHGRLTFVLPRQIGHVAVVDTIDRSVLVNTLNAKRQSA